MWRRIIFGLSLSCGALVLLATTAGALEVPAAPSLATPIVDQTSTLSSEQITELARQIQASRSQKSYQVGVLMIPTLGSGEYLEGYSIKVARAWGIGNKSNNGVLLLIVKDDRLVRIEVGTGLEGDLTDTRAKRIITNVMRPKFKSGEYYRGISEALDSIQLAVTKQADPKLTTDTTDGGSLWDAISSIGFFAIFGLMWLASILARSKSWWAGGLIGAIVGGIAMLSTQWHPLAIVATVILVPFGFLFDYVVSKNYVEHKQNGTLPSWWAGGGSVGHGGGWSGGGGFGGGGFSGGGSSGSW
jgi:uncharacterized protein